MRRSPFTGIVALSAGAVVSAVLLVTAWSVSAAAPMPAASRIGLLVGTV